MRNSGPSFCVLLIACLFVSACGSQKTTVRDASNAIYKSSTITVVADATKRSFQTDDQYRVEFENKLMERLERKAFTTGSGLTLKYWLSDADEGSRSARFWLGFGAGTGKFKVIVEFYDVNGNKLSETENVGTVSGGFTGGSFSAAILNSAESIAAYAKKTYYSKDAVPIAATTSTSPSPLASSAPGASQPARSSSIVTTPAPGLKTWQMAINTNPTGAIIKAYDANQNLVQIGKSPASFLWPLLTEADTLVVVWQGRQLSLLPTFLESISVDFSQNPPVVKGGTVIENVR